MPAVPVLFKWLAGRICVSLKPRVQDESPAGLATNHHHRGMEIGTSVPKTVMIVEDNELNMKLFNDLLRANGYVTLPMRNGYEALDALKENRPDLIIMDIQLPEISGLEVTKRIKQDEALRAIPVIAVTAFAMKGDEERIRQGGCEAYISKPISVKHFLDVVRKHLGPVEALVP
jgi:two-component system cell cycle response regulator DivK